MDELFREVTDQFEHLNDEVSFLVAFPKEAWIVTDQRFSLNAWKFDYDLQQCSEELTRDVKEDYAQEAFIGLNVIRDTLEMIINANTDPPPSGLADSIRQLGEEIQKLVELEWKYHPVELPSSLTS